MLRRGVAASFFVVVLLLVHPGLAHAGPAAPQPIVLTQPDGGELAARPYGDEWINGYETIDGYTIIQDEMGVWTYAMLDDRGLLAPSSRRPDRDRPGNIAPHLRGVVLPTPEPRLSTTGNGKLMGNTGSQYTLVLLASFSNRGSVGSSAADWSQRVFGSAASVQDYYRESSYNQLTLIPAVESHGTANDGIIGWLNLGYPHPNTRGNVTDANRSIVRNVLIAADPYIDFAAYDTDHNGYISAGELHLVVIVAGYETSYGGATGSCSPSIWAHHWALGGTVAAPTLDGVVIGGSNGGGYSELGEWHCTTSDNPGHLATMGGVVHELGHDLNWPDLYDTDGSSEGVGEWSIMGSGSWLRTGGYAGSMPAHPDAFLKWYQGWLAPEQVDQTSSNVALQQVETYQRAILLRNNPGGIDWVFGSRSGSGEYFLLENRQKVGYDAGLKGCGVLIWHIDESRPFDNTANATDTRRLVDLEEADGRNDLDSRANRSDAGDPYPGSTGNTIFGRSSNPNSHLYDGSDSWVTVSNISSCAETASIDIVVPVTVTIPLTTGWNLMSVTVVAPSTAITSVLATITGHYDLVYAYDAFTPSDPWKVYDVGAAATFNTLHEISNTAGIWIRVSDPVTLTVGGIVPLSSQTDLAAGWNLVGYPSELTRPITQALATISGTYDLVYAYNAFDPGAPWAVYDASAPATFNTLSEMAPHRGYWIRVTQPCQWRLP